MSDSTLDRFANLDSEVFVDEAVSRAGKDPIAAVGPGPNGGAAHVQPGVLATVATRHFEAAAQ